MARSVVVHASGRLLGEGLGSLLGEQPGLEVVAATSVADELIAVVETGRPDVVVLQVHDLFDACETVRRLRSVSAATAVLGLVPSEAPGQRLARMGFDEVATLEDRIQAIAAVIIRCTRDTADLDHRGSPTSLLHGARRNGTTALLTERQREVFRWARRGATSREMAAQLGISVTTVDKHKREIRMRLGAHSTAHALALTAMQGSVSAGRDRHVGQVAHGG